VRIEYVPSPRQLEDPAWDFVHFRDFSRHKIGLQFSNLWQGCTRSLAARLLLDLVRLTEFAQRKGEAGR